ALHALVGLAGERRSWAVLGVMHELGAGAEDAHETAGRLAARLGVDRVVAVGEGARAVARGASGGGNEAAYVPSAVASVRLPSGELRPGDVVLVKASRAEALERVVAALLEGAPA